VAIRKTPRSPFLKVFISWKMKSNENDSCCQRKELYFGLPSHFPQDQQHQFEYHHFVCIVDLWGQCHRFKLWPTSGQIFQE
jgi:hypothetical protein